MWRKVSIFYRIILIIFQYLSSCDGIIVIKDGMITERGKHEELMQQDGEYSSLINTYYTQEEAEEITDGKLEN